MSRLYDNSVSYFNAYYNARQTFDEAETALIAAQREARAKTSASQQPAPVPVPKDKFNAVIDKCSSILSFYPESALVDDALLLIGKSYYYLQDYLKAERKFSELFAQYPNSELALEGQLWFAKTLERLRKDDEAKQVAAQLAQLAAEQGEQEFTYEAYTLLGVIAERENAAEPAIGYYSNALEHVQDDYSKASLYAKIGDLYFSLQDYDKADAAYLKVSEVGVSDTYLNYYSRVQAARAYAALKRYDSALFLTEEMLDDYRFASFHPMIRFEYAGILLASGFTDDAIAEYQFMDTAYVRTEAGANASFALARYYEIQLSDYPRARNYYARAASVSSAQIVQKAKQRENALFRVMTLQRELFLNDSVFAMSDSMRQYPENFIRPDTAARRDTLTVQRDSLSIQTDSLSSKPTDVRAVYKPANADSMRTLKAKIAYDLGEIYYADMDVPDSALAWFQYALELKVDSIRTPRALFILAELRKNTQKSTEGELAELYQTILTKYPWSSYANEARRILGMPVSERTTEEYDMAYAVAESLLWAGHDHTAIERLQTIVQGSSSPALVAKSQYAIGWIYENRLFQPDSALTYYRSVLDQHKTSPYAAAVKNKIDGATQEAKQGQPVQQAQPPNAQQSAPVIDDERKPPSRLPRGRGARPDTAKVKIKE
ncbi:MAG TPA: tetratricopeptide repeat protein [Bacteroidota bacterium]